MGRDWLDATSPYENRDLANWSLLSSSQEGDIDGIEKALNAGADINTRPTMWMRRGTRGTSECGPGNPDGSGLTPLMHASIEGHVEAVKLLIAHGAELRLQDTDGMQAFHLAAEAASAECFHALLAAGANPLAKDNFDRSALECLPPSCSSRKEWQAVFQQVQTRVPSGDASFDKLAVVSEQITEALGHDDEDGKEGFTSAA